MQIEQSNSFENIIITTIIIIVVEVHLQTEQQI